MKNLPGISILIVLALVGGFLHAADTKIPLNQLKAVVTPSTNNLVMVSADATGKVTITPVGIGKGLSMVTVAGGWELQAVAPVVASNTYTNVKMKQLSDGTWTPVTALAGKVLPQTIEVHRNGVLQDDSDYSFDGSNNSIKMVMPLDPTDKLVFSAITVS